MGKYNQFQFFLIGHDLDNVVDFNLTKFWLAKTGYLLSLSGKNKHKFGF
jgi:hypothetical protein